MAQQRMEDAVCDATNADHCTIADHKKLLHTTQKRIPVALDAYSVTAHKAIIKRYYKAK